MIRFLRPNVSYEGQFTMISGYVEIYHENLWGSICDDYFGDASANVICKIGGYIAGIYDNGIYKQNYLGLHKASKIWLDDVRCNGSETNVDQCNHTSWGQNNCNRREDIGIKCVCKFVNHIKYISFFNITNV